LAQDEGGSARHDEGEASCWGSSCLILPGPVIAEFAHIYHTNPRPLSLKAPPERLVLLSSRVLGSVEVAAATVADACVIYDYLGPFADLMRLARSALGSEVARVRQVALVAPSDEPGSVGESLSG
jgi:hypothetical protein